MTNLLINHDDQIVEKRNYFNENKYKNKIGSDKIRVLSIVSKLLFGKPQKVSRWAGQKL